MKSNARTVFCFTILLSAFLCVFGRSYGREQYPLSRFHQDSLKKTEDRIFFFTQPRSGTYWTLYIMKHFSKRPSSHHNIFFNFYDQKDNLSLPFIHHFHGIDIVQAGFRNNLFQFSPPDIKKDKVLTIIRNPLDILLRDSDSFEHALQRINYHNWITSILIYLENWPTDSHYILYYEDLLDHPKEEIKKLLSFINVRDDGVDDFIANLDYHKNFTISHYDATNKSYTKGKDRMLYQRKYTKEQLKTLVSLLKEIDPVIWNKYLKRYEMQ